MTFMGDLKHKVVRKAIDRKKRFLEMVTVTPLLFGLKVSF